MKSIPLLAAVLIFAPHLPADTQAVPDKPDIRVSVKAESMGTERGKASRVSSRRLVIHVENHEHQSVGDLQVQWKIFSRDINSRREKVAASGKRDLKLDADDGMDVETPVVRFTERDGKSKATGKGKNKRQTAQPDTGEDYAGYTVEITRNGKPVARAGTLGHN
jgi:hypothetical protein